MASTHEQVQKETSVTSNKMEREMQGMSTPSTSIVTYLRSFRVAGIAMFDVVASVYMCGWLNERYGTGSFKHGAMAAIPIGIVVHLLFGINTTLNYYLGLSPLPVTE